MNETSKTVEQAVAAAQVPGDFPTRAQLEGEIAGTVEAIARGRGDGGTLGVEDAARDSGNPEGFGLLSDHETCDHGVSLAAPCTECGTESRVLATLAPETDLGVDDAGTGGSGVVIETESAPGTATCDHGLPTVAACGDCGRDIAIAIDLSADAPPPVDVPAGRDTTRVLVCRLSAEDTAERGVELAQKLQELADAVDELKTIGHEKREHIKRLEGDVQRLKTATLDRTESRETPVREVRDYKTGTVKFYRMDTCQEVTSLLRQMTEAEKDEERQVPLFSEGGNATVTATDDEDAEDANESGVDEQPAAEHNATCTSVPTMCAGGCGKAVCEDPECPAGDGGVYLGSNRVACSEACADKADAAEQADTGGEG